MVESQCLAFNIPPITLPNPDKWLVDDCSLSCCNGVTILHTYYMPGSVSFLFYTQKLLIAGDTFKGSIVEPIYLSGDF